MNRRILFSVIPILFLIFSQCKNPVKFSEDFDRYNNRVWINENIWPIPLEDWRLVNGKIECVGKRANMRLNLLTCETKGQGSYSLSVKMGLLEKRNKHDDAGFRIGVNDKTDNDLRSVCYFGKGIDVGINTKGFIFINDKQSELGEGFDMSEFTLNVKVESNDSLNTVHLNCYDENNNQATLTSKTEKEVQGNLQIVNNFNKDGNPAKSATFWFDDIKLSGNMVQMKKENTFGPILWTMYTLNKGTSLKMTAQMPPLSKQDNHLASLQIKQENNWQTIQEKEIDPESYLAVFKYTLNQLKQDLPYRILYTEKYKNGQSKKHYYEGIIRKEPEDEKLEMGALTCQYHYGFPYRPVTDNLKLKDPDILYFSGDQIYEGNGGYNIIREPADKAILNYLGKWYMFGWAFGDLMRNRPTICIPDDHEVYQGNLWGQGGKKITVDEFKEQRDYAGGFVQPLDMIDVVMETNTAHLPDPYDPKPMKNGIKVYYTDLIYGGVSFAIVGDRLFKSEPTSVAFWKNKRKDHLTIKLDDPSVIDHDSLKLLGDRQLKFLDHWVRDWKGAEMKVLLSQTIFANAATHHGRKRQFLYGDLDSGGWPKTARDKAISIIRKSFAFHINGDQHLPSLIHYGIDECSDAGWGYCTPAIAVGYPSAFLPDKLDWKVTNRPNHGNPNTGCYTDAFGNINYIYAIGNPNETMEHPNRYQKAQLKSSGFGYIEFNLNDRTIESHAYRFLANLNDDKTIKDQFPGWPLKINQMDNYAREAYAYLPTVKLQNDSEPILKLINEATNELVYAIRMNSKSFSPKVFQEGIYRLEIGIGNKLQKFRNLKPVKSKNDNTLEVEI